MKAMDSAGAPVSVSRIAHKKLICHVSAVTAVSHDGVCMSISGQTPRLVIREERRLQSAVPQHCDSLVTFSALSRRFHHFV